MGISKDAVKDVIREGHFSRKVNTMQEALVDANATIDRYKIIEFVSLEEEAFCEFACGFLEEYPFLAGKGDIGCDLEVFQGRDYAWLSKEERQLYNEFCYRECVAVHCPTQRLCFVVDPQGYEYARYVHITAYQNLI
ncbi:hypothetical protein HCJ46_16135 [Listeria booriae]|uniref:hypothetical protein n=1 Tax=Listeria booriae TaxID=1552123 RepID=UPI0016251630|nr:hypothetical protein [Listeria booriae]MBC1920289.1 hypothetical protein [Listeria booriae]MBC2164683.1 hypothetical protein [Listeria booriae]